MRWAQPTPQKGATKRFGVLADSGDGGAQWSGQGFDLTHNTTHAGGIDRNTTMRSPNEKENKLERGSRMVLVHCVPRGQWLMKEAETKSVVAVAKDIPRAGGTVNSTRAICPRRGWHAQGS